MSANILAIFFDMNGTLRTREPHPPTQAAALQKILSIIEKNTAAQDFWDTLSQRYLEYSNWAQTHLVTASEEEIWTRWLLPEEPSVRLAAQADELMLAWLERKGRGVPKPGAQETLAELSRRGYSLGVISNTVSTLDIPRFIHAHGWEQYLKTIVLSSQAKSRKPAPDLFFKAAKEIGVDPAQCAYVGNRIAKDIVGCKRAGFAMSIMIEPLGSPHHEEPVEPTQPQLVVQSLPDLLDFFPYLPVHERQSQKI